MSNGARQLVVDIKFDSRRYIVMRRAIRAEGQQIKLALILIPESEIISPLANKDQFQRYQSRGWIPSDLEKLDRMFMRDPDGQPYIPSSWIEGAVKQVCRELNIDHKPILDKLRISNLTSPDPPLIRRRLIMGSGVLEMYESLDSSYQLRGILEFQDGDALKQFAKLIHEAGIRCGIGARRSKGMGRFRVKLEEFRG